MNFDITKYMKKGSVLAILLLLTLSSCGSGDYEECETAARNFMDTMAQGNPNDALKYCDDSYVQGSHVRALWKNETFAEFWTNYQGLEFTGKGNISKDGRYLKLDPIKVKGTTGYTVDISLRKTEQGWKVAGVKILPPKH